MIPYFELQTQYKKIKNEIRTAIDHVLTSGQYVLGQEVAQFESEFAAYCECSHAVAVSSGTSALHLALLAAGVSRGDEVITVPFTFIATASAIDYTGAIPVFVDIDPQTFLMDVKQVEKAITPRTKVILPVHLYGQSVDLEPLLAIAKKNNLKVVEDAAQAHGALYNGKKVGSMGDLGCFSFYPGKNLGAYGEGGIVVTSNEQYAKKIRALRDWGQEKKYHHIYKGFNYRMEGFRGAILRVKLRYLDEWNAARRERARLYDRLLEKSSVKTPRLLEYREHAYHVYAVRHPKRDDLKNFLEKEGVGTLIHYPVPVHLQEAFKELGHSTGSFPASEKAAQEVLSLPMYPEMKLEDVETVSKLIQRFAQ